MTAFENVYPFACQRNLEGDLCLSAVGSLLRISGNGYGDDDDDDGTDDDDGSPLVSPTRQQCILAQSTGCCFTNLLSSSFDAVQASYLKLSELTVLQTFVPQCKSIYNITLSSLLCANTKLSTCQGIMNKLSPECTMFMVQLNSQVRTINGSLSNEQLCQHPCYRSVSIALYSLITNGMGLFRERFRSLSSAAFGSSVLMSSSLSQAVNWNFLDGKRSQTCSMNHGLLVSWVSMRLRSEISPVTAG